MHTIEVYVKTDDECRIPHFHVRKHSAGFKRLLKYFEWEACVKFEEAALVHHGEYSDSLPKDFGKELNMFFDLQDRYCIGKTYWSYAVISWNRNNEDASLPWELEQPDYSQL